MHTQRNECEVLTNLCVCIVRPDPIYSIYSDPKVLIGDGFQIRPLSGDVTEDSGLCMQK